MALSIPRAVEQRSVLTYNIGGALPGQPHLILVQVMPYDRRMRDGTRRQSHQFQRQYLARKYRAALDQALNPTQPTNREFDDDHLINPPHPPFPTANSLAFTSMGTPVQGWTYLAAIDVALETIIDWFNQDPSRVNSINRIVFLCPAIDDQWARPQVARRAWISMLG